METMSVNGKLIPTNDNESITDQYLGHFLKISYSQEISGHPVFSKDRVDVELDGIFRFYLPLKNLVINEAVKIAIFAPDGEMLGQQNYSYTSLKPSNVPINVVDESPVFNIKINPKVIAFNIESPVEKAIKKITGKVIDSTAEQATGGLQVVIMVSDDPVALLDSSSFHAVFSATTDNQGYFYGQVPNKSIQQAFGVIAGNLTQPIVIGLDDNRLPKNILLVSDLSALEPDNDCACNEAVPLLPDSDDLVNSGAFSQDIGGKCVDFTVPNRTLEETSFYHTVRTTEPEIRGFTITVKDSKKFKFELFEISKNIFTTINKLNDSFSSLSMQPLVIEEVAMKDDTVNMTRVMASRLGEKTAPALPNYMLKMNFADTQQLKIHTHDLQSINKNLVFSDLLSILKQQEQRRKKLSSLQHKLAAAYCGKNGVESAKTFCETLTAKDTLNREEVRALLGHIEKNLGLLALSPANKKHFTKAILELEKLVNNTQVTAQMLNNAIKVVEQTILLIDDVPNSVNQERMLGDLRRLMIELANASETTQLGFEPCPTATKPTTMGIMCLTIEFEKIKTTLKNSVLLSLPEITMIREYYLIFQDSITAFIDLLDEYYNFYRNGSTFVNELVDDYFYRHYDEIRSRLLGLMKQISSGISQIENIEQAYIVNHPGRVNLTVESSINWDENITIHENTTIANGHILHIKQIWKAAGFSLGDCLYSMPLAPCQEKQIAIVDWDRKETSARTEAQIVSEEITADIIRDRDITEIMHSSLNESLVANSSNSTSSTSAGIGGGIGGFIAPVVFGVAGGISHSGASSKSNASQNSARNVSGSALNRLKDSTSQSASSVRSQRSTVVQTIGQNESVNVQTEVIKNNNHCHAVTIEYFEVLKHYAIEQKLVDVQECLYVPLPMSLFDNQKVLRWRNTLKRAVYGKTLHRGFSAIERIEDEYINADLPDGRYVDEVIQNFSGYFTLSFELARPFIRIIEEATKTEEYDLLILFPWFPGRMVLNLEREVPLTEAEKDTIFEQEYAPKIIKKFIDTLQFDAIADDGSELQLDLDMTILSNYRKGAPLKVNIASKSIPTITRAQINHLRLRANTNVNSSSKIILRSLYLHYKTKYLSEYIVRNHRVNNDIINSMQIQNLFDIITVTDAALMYVPANTNELRNPKKEDKAAASALISFLNEHLEMAHKVIWSSMDASRLFGLLDGFIAPYSGGKSVASVVENKIMGIVGNNLVLKVVPGERLDPTFRGVDDLLAYYQPTTAPDPFRVSVPTKGVYAESVMGQCNSCEKIDESRHWRFNDEPCGTTPTAINPIDTGSRRSDPGNLQAKDFPASIINMQNAPTAPDPTSLGSAFELLSKADVFKDITGLTGTQQNALAALQTTSKSVTDLASISKDFAGLSVMANQKKDGAKLIEQIKKLNKDGYLTDDETHDQITKVLDSFTDAAKSVTKKEDDPITTKEIEEVAKASDANKVDVEVDKKSGKIKTKSNRSKPRVSAAEQQKVVIGFNLSDDSSLPMNGLLRADILLLLPDAEPVLIGDLIVDAGLTSVTAEMPVKSGVKGQLHVKFFSAFNPYQAANTSADIDLNNPFKGSVSFTITNDGQALVFNIVPKSIEYTIISSSKQAAIQAVSNSEKVTKGGKIYAEAEGSIPFISTVKAGVEVSGSLENDTTIVDTNMVEGELGISFKMRLPTGGLIITKG
ncbi:hypothetical protein H4J51_05465 [Colwellia sp. MB02u-18]|uniref:hypothetical protein n=1 Tax=unclassified Colwellia TaxID=196834 RepID=UPI0015F55883|nr:MULTISPECIES: hypothetical protein [unclassified Colwellia]MBA6223547.1 hypothetical protein [Colwellia sp. MB3u-45]MBA6269096.1 hypothetical protein [Colwellia sp. MB3u-43]MBA6320818.1 hypothetical protein [Colwellia sp. MB02u-19]MBA6324030.1 hypothetical protein [Colwellia sp. MB02u-18]MBA6330966.1 hypothetical protein [Colwellia sp. MB02u-12]